MTKYILSIDGGGIRGIIPAIILAEVEKRTRKRVAEIFHLMAGTSTGGIVVAGLCKKDKPQYSANDLSFTKSTEHIFLSLHFLGDQYYLGLTVHNIHIKILNWY